MKQVRIALSVQVVRVSVHVKLVLLLGKSLFLVKLVFLCMPSHCVHAFSLFVHSNFCLLPVHSFSLFLHVNTLSVHSFSLSVHVNTLYVHAFSNIIFYDSFKKEEEGQ